MECEVEAGEVERPLGLPPVQLLGRHEVLQVLVIRPDLALMFHALDKVPPLLEGSEVTLPFSLVNAVCSASPQRQPELFQVKSKSGRACSEKSQMNRR